MGFYSGRHFVWLRIEVGDGPIMQHKLVTVIAKDEGQPRSTTIRVSAIFS